MIASEMGIRSRSVSPPESAPGPESTAAQRSPQRARRRGRAWPSLILGLIFVVFKAHVLADLLVHRAELIVLLGIGLILSVLRPSPRVFAAGAAGLLALGLDPRSTAVGVGLAVGSFAVLLSVFIAIGTVLRSRQDDGRARSEGRARVRP